MVRFVVEEHAVQPGRQVVEVWRDGRMIAAVYAAPEGRGIRVISKHETSISEVAREGTGGITALTLTITER
jgi:hypothetical protein